MFLIHPQNLSRHSTRGISQKWLVWYQTRTKTLVGKSATSSPYMAHDISIYSIYNNIHIYIYDIIIYIYCLIIYYLYIYIFIKLYKYTSTQHVDTGPKVRLSKNMAPFWGQHRHRWRIHCEIRWGWKWSYQHRFWKPMKVLTWENYYGKYFSWKISLSDQHWIYFAKYWKENYDAKWWIYVS